MATPKSIKGVRLNSKRILLRAGFDVPFKNGKVADDTRIREGLATIKILLKQGARKVTIITHLGRPGGKPVSSLSSRPVARHLKRLLGSDSSRIEVKENLRFDWREQAGEMSFAKELARGQDVFVQDAFSVLHRRGASIIQLPRLLEHYAGLLVVKEIKHLANLLKNLSNYTIIVGGAKLKEKIPFLNFALARAEQVLAGGKVANVLLKRGRTPPNSQLSLPTDGVIANGQIQKVEDVVDFEQIYDLGPDTIGNYLDIIKKSQRVFWVGNLGKTEEKKFTRGSLEIGKLLVEKGAMSIPAGGDTIAFLNSVGLLKQFPFYSTGGGATLEYLRRGGKLPGLEALMS